MSMNSQWNVVTKSKKQKNLEKKVEARLEQKRLAGQLPKLEEILPSHQINNIVTGRNERPNTNGKARQNVANDRDAAQKPKSPNKKVKEKAKKGDDSKKQQHHNHPHQQQQQQQQQHQHQQHQQQQQPKSKGNKLKSLEVVMRSLDAKDLCSHLEQLKIQFQNSELLWLHGIAAYFNDALPFESHPTFSGKSHNYPMCLASKELLSSLMDFLKSVGEVNLNYFYHSLLNSMANKLNNNLPAVGYKFILQVIGQNWPYMCSNDMAKTALLRNSYQNQPNICLSIFWAIGQGGLVNLMTGIKVWQNLMFPNMEMRHYSKYVIEYIEKILTVSLTKCLDLNQNDFFNIYHMLRMSRPNLPNNQKESLKKSAELFLQNYIVGCSKTSNVFLSLLRLIESSTENRIEIDGCISCLYENPSDCVVWKMNYKKQLLPSTLLLQRIYTLITDPNESAPYIKAVDTEEFHTFLKEIETINMELRLSKKHSQMHELFDAFENVKTALEKGAKRKAEEKKDCGCCKWVLGSLLILSLIVGVLVYDTQVNGKGVFEKSSAGKILKDAGLLPYVEKVWYTTMGASARAYKWADKNVPPYASPIIKLSCDLFKLTKNASCNAFHAVKDLFMAKLPVASNFVEQYVPGLPQKIEDTFLTIQKISIDVYGKTLAFFQTQVLVGNLSPESLGKALNQTQNVALEYYKIFLQKVDAYAKLK